MKKLSLRESKNLAGTKLGRCGIAADVMNRKVESIGPNETVLDAIEILVDRRIRSLVVLPGEDGEHGVVTFRDVILKCLSEGLEPKDVKVNEISSKPLVYVEPDLQVGDIVKVMKENNVSRVFVKEDDKVVGVIAPLDIVATCLTGEI